MRKYFVGLLIAIIAIVSVVPIFGAETSLETVNDGRINQDNHASYVIFADGENGLVLLRPTGEFLFALSAEEIALTDTMPSVITLLASGDGISVYRMTDGGFHVSGPSLNVEKNYIVRFINPVANTPYTSYEE